MTEKGKIVCFGELLLRLNAPGNERLLQTNALTVHVGGAEVNVAVALAQFGADASMTSIASTNALGDAAVKSLRSFGVDVRNCDRRDGRMGLYFMSAGAVLRPSEILYDRAHSIFAETSADNYDWDKILTGASWLHISGITPAIGQKTSEAVLAAVRQAVKSNVKVSFDGNYRAHLWLGWAGDGPAILAEILSHATIAFIDHRDVGLILSKDYSGSLDEKCEKGREDAFGAFPKLEMIASTVRTQSSVCDHILSASIATREATWSSREAEMPGVVDRIGGGDAFAAGVLYTLWDGGGQQCAVDFGLAASLLKHSIPGDALIATRADVEAQMQEGGLDVRR